MMRKVSVLFASAALMMALASSVGAAVPSVIPFQGRLTDASGTPVNGNQSILFALFTAPTGGSAVWSETQPTVAVANGLFNVDLGSVTAIPATIFTGGDLFLEIKITSESAAMTPRQRMGTVAYAQRAGISSQAGSATTSGMNLTTQNPGTVDLITYTAVFPGPGVAVVNGYVVLGWSGTTTGEYNLNITQSSLASPFSTNTTFEFHQNPAGGTYRQVLTNMHTFSIPAAGSRTFFLTGNAQASAYEVWGSHLDVQFFPDAIGPIGAPSPEPALVNEPSDQTSIERRGLRTKSANR